MADATRNIPNSSASCGPASQCMFPLVSIDSGAQLYQGALVFRDPADSMYLKSAAPSGNPQFLPYGVADAKQLGDGNLQGELQHGPHVFDNSATSGEIVPATLWLGYPLYAKDNRTVSLTDGGGLYPRAGWFGGMSGESTPRPIVWVGFCPFAIEEFVVSKAIGHADLTDADTTQEFTLLTLPGPAVVMGPPWIRSKTDFSGGGTGSATLAIGVGADVDALGDERDVFTGSTAVPAAMTAGVNGAAGYPLAATSVINATVVADTTVAAFTAGAVVVSLRLKAGSY